MDFRNVLLLGVGLACQVYGALAPLQAQSQPVITEFMADNSKTLADQDQDFEDWVEIFNPGSTPIDLGGYFLTDDASDRAKWKFPAVTLAPKQFLVVFCSGKNRSNPSGELHTSFKLDADREDLLLVAPNGSTVVSGYADYPEQIADVSYGFATDSTFGTAVSTDAELRVLVPAEADQAAAWTAVDFDDAGWLAGRAAVGFGMTAPELAQTATDVRDAMLNVNASCWIRIAFDVPDPALIDLMKLFIQYDDGYAAFLNGQRVAGGNAPEALAWNSQAARSHSGKTVDTVDLSQYAGLLRAGKNVLAIQGMNSSATGSDFFIRPRLDLIDLGPIRTDARWYFGEPTPGDVNGAGFPQVAPDPVISHDGGTYIESVTIEITTPLEGGVIRYTLDGRIPDASSPEYAGPIAITGVTRVYARTFKDGVLPSKPESETYIVLHPGAAAFSTNVPLVIVTTFLRPIGSNCGGGPYTPGHVLLIKPGENGQAAITDDAFLSNNAQFRRRGSSTCGNEKFSMNVEILDAEGRDKNVRIIDEFPIESDYILYAPNNFDRALIRNPIAYHMSNMVDVYAARTRNVEVYYHTGRGPVEARHYFGVYNLEEKMKQHPEKIAVEQITSQDNAEPEVSGGYVLRRDRVGPDEIAISAGGYGSLVFVYPKVPSAQQRTWLTQFLNRAIGSLNPNIGSQEDNDLIDFNAFLDHHILNWYPKNVDAFRLSGYFHKARNRPLAMGPVWDYDRTMGCSDDDRARTPEGWNNDSSGDGGTRYFEAGGLGSWYSMLFQNQPPTRDTPWNNAYKSRWREFRRDKLTTAKILAQLDFYANELSAPSARNFQRWPGHRPRFGNHQGEMNHIKNWLSVRADWIDTQFIATPRFNPRGGVVDQGTMVEIAVDSGAPIYYTLDNSDPRGADSRPSATAVEYRGAIAVQSNVRIRARSLEGGSLWSAVAEQVYVTELPTLAITELMYSPLPPTPEESAQGSFSASSFEFIEITNIGAEPVPLAGVHFARGVTLTLDGVALSTLAPGESCVVVENVEAFAVRYPGGGVKIAGDYSGRLTDTGESVTLAGAFDETIVDFSFRGDWHPDTNGLGRSLVNADPLGPPEALGTAAGWRPSAAVHGSPGVPDALIPSGRRRPGDLTADGRLNVNDVVGLLRALFLGGASLPCGDALDAVGNRNVLDWNGDAGVNLSDAVHALRHIYQQGPPHAAGSGCVAIEGCGEACAN